MKVSKLFHWLYASVMFIPLLITALLGLAVRSDNNFQPIEVTAQENKVVDFNQLYNSNQSFIVDGNFTLNTDNVNVGDKLILKVDLNIDVNILQDGGSIGAFTSGTTYYYIYTSLNPISTFNYENLITSESSNVRFGVFFENVEINSFVVSNLQCFNLTKMFGVGNEPTLTQFNSWYSNEYYEYTLSHKELLKDTGTITYSDTDVGSQLVYTLYNATDKYFNFNQFLGIGNLFDWFQLNVFNGNAPLGFIIFWNLLIYWLLVSIAWLIFDIAMYVPKLAHRWLDKASLE